MSARLPSNGHRPSVNRPGPVGLRFGMFASCVARDGAPDIKGTPKELYMVLVTFSDIEGRNTKKGYPYRSVLAKALGVSVKTVDRATRALAATGLLSVEQRKVEGKPDENDANLYTLHDGWLIHGVEPDDSVPLQLVERYGHQIPGFDVAGYLRERGGGDTSVSTPGDTSVSTGRDTGVPQSRESCPEPVCEDESDAPSGRSPGERRRPTTGSKGSSSSGFAASGNNKAAPVKLTAAERKVRDSVLLLLPHDLREALGTVIPTNVGRGILDALGAGTPRERTPQQLVEHRVLPRWNRYWASKFYAGDLTPDLGGGKRKRPFGPLLEMIKDTPECNNLTCEDRHDFVLGGDCRNCEMRKSDKAADRARERREGQEDAAAPAAPMPVQRGNTTVHVPQPDEWWDCMTCHRVGKGEPPPDGICGVCVKEKEHQAEIAAQQAAQAARYEVPEEEFASTAPAPF
ncbi:hypothetical protein [Streptomyces sp. 030-HV]|uniref:hypothetical protein n=1 Tax=Streptomyces sp. 030-HV TaxID=2789262 RepID=UPI003980B52A